MAEDFAFAEQRSTIARGSSGQAEKQAVAGAEVAEIKKSVRRHLKQQLFGELEEGEHRHRQDSLD
jgi:hypothetical protein